jgi:hypothetical protein
MPTINRLLLGTINIWASTITRVTFQGGCIVDRENENMGGHNNVRDIPVGAIISPCHWDRESFARTIGPAGLI